MWKKVVVDNFKILFWHLSGELRKICHYSWSLSPDLNLGPPKYEEDCSALGYDVRCKQMTTTWRHIRSTESRSSQLKPVRAKYGLLGQHFLRSKQMMKTVITTTYPYIRDEMYFQCILACSEVRNGVPCPRLHQDAKECCPSYRHKKARHITISVSFCTFHGFHRTLCIVFNIA
jgi:hypothetical protein